jgi:hypothetical protein
MPGRALAPTLAFLIPLSSLTLAPGCKDEPKPTGGTPPPPPPASAKTDACAGGGGVVDDAPTAAFFPRTVSGYCIDPQGDAKTYGEKAKLDMKQICTTALDGGCEEYMQFGVTRSVILRYVEGAGGGGTVEVFLSQFAGDGAFGIYTTRVVGDSDPADPATPRPMKAGALGGLGTGKAYAWKGSYFLELTYANDEQTPEQLKKSSDTILPALAAAIGDKLPDTPGMPTAATLLPEAERVPQGVLYFPKAALGMTSAGAGALGFYKTDAGKRYRVLVLARADVEQGKDALRGVRTPGVLPLAGVGDEAFHGLLQPAVGRPKTEWVFARKGAVVVGLGDEELLAGPAAATGAKPGAEALSKEEKVAKLKAIVAALPAPAKK